MIFKLEGYCGVDLVNWPVKMADLDANIGDIGACFGNGIVIWNNVIVFPKVLNELSGEDIDELVEGILQTKFPAREYYICFSHNRSKVVGYHYSNSDNGLRISGRIVDAFMEAITDGGNVGRPFCTSDIIGRDNRANYLREIFKDEITDELCTSFVLMDSGFYSVGYSFTHADGVQANRFSDYDDTFCIRISPNKTMAQYFNQLDDIADVMNRTSSLVFQIVKIRR